MNILFLASEVVPFIKSGGLADVAGALPKALKNTDTRVILPLYSLIDRNKHKIKKIADNSCVHMGNCEEFFSVYVSETAPVPTYFIEFNKYFDRNGIYDDKYSKEEFQDNAYRYAFFSKAALQVAQDLNFKPDVVHVNDWQTALVPYYLKRDGNPFFYNTKSVLTIHNMGYQGIYGADVLSYAGIRPEDFNSDTFEAFGRVNLLKGGIAYADKITTVSPTYAKEILNYPGGFGLENYLRRREWDLAGFINGIDTKIWNPAHDDLLPLSYTADTYKKGKAVCKTKLQDTFYLERSSRPIFAMVARLVSQKGICLLTSCLEDILQQMSCQFVVLGTGDPSVGDYLSGLCTKYPGQFGCYIGYNEKLAHLVEAGSDFFVMPSLYEPCGLNQLYSQVYGTLPIVRGTGGLEDTIQNYDETTGNGTGFKFYDTTKEALFNTIGWANATYYDRPNHMDKMIRKAMSLDYSWESSAELYRGLYKELYTTAHSL